MRGHADAVKLPSRARTVSCLHAGMSAALQQRRFHYAFVIAAVTFVVLMMAAGFRSVPSVLIVPLGKEFGWSHALIGGAVSINLIVYGPGAPVRGGTVAGVGG